MTYQIIINYLGKSIITKESDGIIYYIPEDLDNSDYQEYLNWLENQA